MSTTSPTTSSPRKFIGRQVVLTKIWESFQNWKLNEQGKYVFYLQADGGMGKTRILRHIEEGCEPFNTTDIVAPMIDFFDLNHISVVGLIDAIVSRLQMLLDLSDDQSSPNFNAAYRAYRTYSRKLDEVQQERHAATASTSIRDSEVMSRDPKWDEASKYQNRAAEFERRLARAAVDLCNTISEKTPVILLFDTFERSHMAATWFTDEFLKQIKNPSVFILIGGRPRPDDKERIGAVATIYPLEGYSPDDLKDYINVVREEKNFTAAELTPDVVTWLLESGCHGNPLQIDLFFDHIYPFAKQEEGWLDKIIEHYVKPTAHSEQGKIIDYERRVLKAMAVLRRRFTEDVLRHLLKQDDYFPNNEFNNERLVTEFHKMLGKYSFLKPYDSLSSHLLHDEMQRLLINLIEQYDPELISQVIGHIHKWYDQGIHDVESEKPEQALQLRAEDFGYFVDEKLAYVTMPTKTDYPAVIKEYKRLREIASQNRQYPFETMLWNELLSHVSAIPTFASAPNEPEPEVNPRYDLYYDRLLWLYQQSLFGQLNRFVAEILAHFGDKLALEDQIDVLRFRGYALFRLARFDESEKELDAGKALISANIETLDYADYYAADYERLKADLYRATSEWDKALESYNQAYSIFQTSRNLHGQVATHNGRCYIMAIRAQFSAAHAEWIAGHDRLDALEVEEGVSGESQRLRAWLFANEGTTHRNAGDYERALVAYQKSLDIAVDINQPEIVVYANQLIGITHVRAGHDALNKREYDDAVKSLTQATTYLFKGLIKANEIDYRSGLMHGFRRLARLYEEAMTLVNIKAVLPDDIQMQVTDLENKLNSFSPPTAEEYDDVVIFERDVPFHDLSAIWQKVVRLNEIAARLGNLTYSTRDELENWINAVLNLVDNAVTRMDTDISIQRLFNKAHESVSAYEGSNAPLFNLYTNLIRFTDLWKYLLEIENSDDGQFDNDGTVIEELSKVLANIRDDSGTPYHIFQNLLDRVGEEIKHFEVARGLYWCEQLQRQWVRLGLWMKYAEFRRKLEEVRHILLR